MDAPPFASADRITADTDLSTVRASVIWSVHPTDDFDSLKRKLLESKRRYYKSVEDKSILEARVSVLQAELEREQAVSRESKSITAKMRSWRGRGGKGGVRAQLPSPQLVRHYLTCAKVTSSMSSNIISSLVTA